jgi:TPR repeat protein
MPMSRNVAPSLARALSIGLLVSRADAGDGDWIEVRSPHFTVVSDAGDSRARRVAQRFEQIRAVFEALAPGTRLDPPRPIVILAPRGENGLKELLPGFWETKGGTRPSGLFAATGLRVYVALRADLDEADTERHSVVFHEYVHLLTALNFDALPLWLSEGLAELYAHSSVERDRVLVGRASPTHVRILREATLLPLDELFSTDASSPHYNEAERATIFYGQSWALTHYLMLGDKGARLPQLKVYADRFAQGVDAAEAAREAFGELRGLRTALDSYVRSVAFYMQPVATQIASAASDYSVRALPPPDSLALRGAFLMATQRFVEARRALEEASRRDPRHAGARRTLSLLSLIEAKVEEARRWGDEALRLEPEGADGQYLKGILELAPGGGKAVAAEPALRRAIDLDPRFAHARSVLALVISEQKRSQQEALELARSAVALDPASLELRVNLATVLARSGDREAARHGLRTALALCRTPQQRTVVQAVLDRLPQEPPGDPKAALAHHQSVCDEGDAASCGKVAHMLERGDGVTKDWPRAAELYGRACERGMAAGCEDQARMLRWGRGVAKDAPRAAALYGKACDGGERDACETLARMVFNGEGAAASDEARAASLMDRACDQGEASACTFLGWMHEHGRGLEKRPATAVPYYEKACETGDAAGCRHLAALLSRGEGVSRDETRAASLHERACNGGDLAGCEELAAALDEGRGIAQDATKAVGVLTKACDAGRQSACVDLGDHYEDGRGVDQDDSRAAALYEKACDGKHAPGCGWLGALHQDGRGVTKDLARAAALYRQACDAGRARFCSYLGWLHESGEGVAQDVSRALELYEGSCEKRYGRGCRYAGLLLNTGRLMPRDASKAAALWNKGCEQGDMWSCANLARLHRAGDGVASDLDRAAALFDKACEGRLAEGCVGLGQLKLTPPAQGLREAEGPFQKACDLDAKSCVKLALLYVGPAGTLRDVARAVALLERSCDSGGAEGCTALAALYAFGEGVPRDRARAKEFYDKGCQGGYAPACAEGEALMR